MNVLLQNSLGKARGVIPLCLCLMLCVSPIAAQAQSKDVTNRLNRLENEIQTLNRAVYKGEKPPAGSIQMDQVDGASMDRLSKLESELRDLTGKVEQQAHDNQQLQIRFDALEQDSRMRLDSLETQMRNVAVPPAGISSQQQSGNFPVTVGNEAPPAPTPIMPVATTVQEQTSSVNQSGQFSEDAAALYEQGFGEIKRQEYEAAEKTFATFVRQHPDHALTPNALYWLGETHYVRKQYDKASRVFAEAFQKFPNGPKGADNLLKLGMSLAGAGKKSDACIALKELKRKYPDGPPPVLTKGDQEITALGCS